VTAQQCARELVLALAFERNQLDAAWRGALLALSALPLFGVADGARISLDKALAVRPPFLEKTLRDAGLVAGPPVPDVSALAPQEPAALPLVDVTLDEPDEPARTRPPPLAKRTAQREEPEPPPPPPSPESLLAARIRETLQLVKLPRDAELELERLPLSVQRGRGKHCVQIERSATVIDGAHPLVQCAVDDVAAYFMLCAVVYGAINAHLGEVTDDHELITRLIEHAASTR
jgi:hypothetical protein